MKKIAILNLGTLEITMQIAQVLDNKTFMMLESYSENTKILEDFENDVPISQTRLNEVLGTLNSFKAISDSKNIDDIFCFADYEYNKIKNEHSFFEQITSKTGYRFSLLAEKDNIDLIYATVVSAMDVTKGVFLNISEHRSYLCHYNRRMIVNQLVFPFGYASFLGELKDLEKENIEKFLMQKIEEVEGVETASWIKEIPLNTSIIMQGKIAGYISKMARKKIDYKFNKDQNFVLGIDDVINACSVFEELPFDSTKKVKNTSFRADAMFIASKLVKLIISSLDYAQAKPLSDMPECDEDCESKSAEGQIIVCDFGTNYGLLFKIVSDFTIPTRPNDVLDFSLSAINAYYNGASNAEYVSKLSTLIFRQLKVLHKLNRSYLTVLKIASRLYDSGSRINPENPDQYGYYALINSPIFGVQHREILLAGFVLMLQKDGGFDLTEWAKYRRIIVKDGEDETEVRLACQRLAVILKLAKAFERYSNSKVTDITCDNLGECVIMKTTVANNSLLEIREAKKLDSEFRRVFNNRKIEIL